MMQVYLDDKPIRCDSFPPTAIVSEVINKIKLQLGDTDAIIISLRCNQTDIKPDLLDSVLAGPASQFDRLDLISASSRQVAMDALRQTRTAFEETFAGVKQAADEFAAGQTATGMTTLLDCLAVWTQVNDSVLQSGELLGLDLQTVDFGGKHVINALRELTTKLDEVKAALESRDNVLLGDILRYEMDETLETWKSLLDGFIEHIEKMLVTKPMAVGATF